MRENCEKIILVFQFFATVFIVAFFPTNFGKLLALLGVWILTFKEISKRELILFSLVCFFFSVIDSASISQSLFFFENPDFFNLPVYQPFMWGYFILHSWKLIGGRVPRRRFLTAFPLAVFFASMFFVNKTDAGIFGGTSVAMTVSFLFFHEKEDVVYFLYAVLIGAIFEIAGMWSGQWDYPSGTLPFWFITLWGGSVFFTRRLLMPYVLKPDKISQ